MNFFLYLSEPEPLAECFLLCSFVVCSIILPFAFQLCQCTPYYDMSLHRSICEYRYRQRKACCQCRWRPALRFCADLSGLCTPQASAHVLFTKYFVSNVIFKSLQFRSIYFVCSRVLCAEIRHRHANTYNSFLSLIRTRAHLFTIIKL